MDLDLGCVASFLAVIEEGHYGRAAERLHISSSALSKRVQRLERQVGVPLLVRDGSGVAGPTLAGERFAARGRPLLAAARAARAAARGEGAALTVRLGVHGPVGDFPSLRQLAEVARRLRQLHPDVKLACRSIPLASTESLLDGVVDVVWGALPPAPAALELTPLMQLERIGVVPTKHQLADAGQVSAADLAELPLLCISDLPPELVSPFLLGDIRPVRRAWLVEVHASDSRSLVSQLQPGQAAVISAGPVPASAVDPRLRELRLTDAPKIPAMAARRRTDRRKPVRSLVEVLPEVAAST